MIVVWEYGEKFFWGGGGVLYTDELSDELLLDIWENLYDLCVWFVCGNGYL